MQFQTILDIAVVEVVEVNVVNIDVAEVEFTSHLVLVVKIFNKNT